MRFLRPHHLEWLTNAATLKRQVSLSLTDRCRDFLREWPGAHMNPTLLRQVYRKHGIRKKKYRWTKHVQERDPAVVSRELAKMKREWAKAKRDGCRLIFLDETLFT